MLSTISHRRFKNSFLISLTILLFIGSISLVARVAASETEEGVREEAASAQRNLQTNMSEQDSANPIFNFFAAIKNSFFPDSVSPSATFTVTVTDDTVDATPGNGICADASGNCSLRAAIQEANATSGNDTINFNFTEAKVIQLDSALTPASLEITEAVTINGTGARLLTIKGNANTASGVFNIKSTVTTVAAAISAMTISDSANRGINNDGNLSLSQVYIKGNTYGIYNTNKLTVTQTLIAGNSNSGVYLTAPSVVNISNTTITDNNSSTSGGGIYSLATDVTLNNVTISHNSATVSGGGIFFNNATSGINVRNTIIAQNSSAAGADIFSATGGVNFVSRGNNFIGISATNIGFVQNTNGDKVGTTATPLNPILGALQNNGGATDTRALGTGSTARDAGNVCVTNSSCTQNNPAANLTIDQRGANFPRNYETGVDIGAFESFYPVPSIISFVPNNWGKAKGEFELVINGTNFVKDSVVRWNGAARVTTFVSNTQIKAQILATDVTTVGQFPITVTNPTPGGGPSQAVNFPVEDCTYSISPTSQNFTISGGTGSIAVTATNGCSWTAATTDSFITVNNGASGTGSGTVNFTVTPNNGIARTGTVTVAGQTFTVNQANGCSFTANPTTVTRPGEAASYSFQLTASNNNCPWVATPNQSWITVATDNGTGSSVINYSLSANSGGSRSGTIAVNGALHSITQEQVCTFTFTPTSATPAATGGIFQFNVTASAPTCTWTTSVTPTSSWITGVTASGTGNGMVSYTIAPNAGNERTGKITVNGQDFNITQASGCTFTLGTNTKNFAAGGGTDSFTFTASDSACNWTATVEPSAANWLTLTNPTTGTGNGSISYTVAANNGMPRSGKILIGGKEFTVTQDNGCTYTVNATSATYPASAGTGSYSVTTSNQNCTWTPTSSETWLTITNPTNGTGNGVINFALAANVGLARSVNVGVNGAISGQSATTPITQQNGCTFTFAPTSATHPAAGGNFSFALTASAPACTWTTSVTPASSWITGVTASGTGNGSVNYTIAANNGSERTGKITVNGQDFNITQSNGCSFTVNPTNRTLPATAGTSNFSVAASNTNCGWTATTTATWITIANPQSGTGNGTVNFDVTANNGPARTATITISDTAGHTATFTVEQANGCTYTLTPVSRDFTPAGTGSGNSTFTVTTSNSGCKWTATKTAAWVSITNGASGTGNGTVTFTVDANTSVARTTNITVNGEVAGQTVNFAVNQVSGCTFTLSPSSTSFDTQGGAGSFNISTSNPACSWTATSNQNWITVVGTTSGSGNDTISYSVGASIFPARTGKITVKENSSTNQAEFTISQADGCTYSLAPSSITIPAAAGNGNFTVNTAAGCTWTASTNTPWISISGSSTDVSGSNQVSFNVTANIAQQRVGTIEIAGRVGTQTVTRVFTVTQENGCTFTLTPTTQNYTSGGGTGTFTVTTATGCTWTSAPAPADVSWLTVTSGGTGGNGNGTVGYTVAANTSPQRTGKIIITGQTRTAEFSVTQNDGCVYTISPAGTSISESGGTRTVEVAGGTGCTWTATPNDAWITVTSGASGTGNGTVTLTIAANSGGERIGTVTIKDKTFTVNQINLNVTNTNDSGPGSLRQAVLNANNTPTSDVINILIPSGFIALTSGEIPIINNGAGNNGTLEIRGPGADKLIISGGNNSRIFYIARVTVTIKSVTLTSGNGVGSQSLPERKFGGAIYFNVCRGSNTDCPSTAAQSDSLILEKVKLSNNTITVPNEPGFSSAGGAIYYYGGNNHQITNSTISVNNSFFGGGISNQSGVVNITNSTFAFNRAAKTGGGIHTLGGTINLRNSTIAYNTVTDTGNVGAGIFNSGASIDFTNTIISANTYALPNIGGPEITYANGAMNSLGNNMVGDSAGDSTNTVSPITYQPSDILDVPGRLGTYGLYGGSMETIPLTPASPALNAGNNSNSPATDQRGAPRVVGTGMDIGAFENTILITPTASVVNSGSVGVNYYQTFLATKVDGSNDSFEYFKADGFFPQGLILNQFPNVDGTLLQGIPASGTNGVYEFSVKAFGTNGFGGESVKYSLTVGCPITLAPFNQNFQSTGGSGSISLTAASTCAWTASVRLTDQPWLTITSPNPGNGTGNGTINFSVSANNGPQREGKLIIGGQEYTITQANGCSYSISPSQASYPFQGDTAALSGLFNVTAVSGCQWTAAKSAGADWITINTGTSGTGNGQVSYTLAPNPGVARTAKITVTGASGEVKEFTITQAGGCSYSLSASSQNVPASGGTGSFILNTGTGCAWAATTTNTWITIGTPTSGTGTGTISYTVAANTGVARIGKITFAGGTEFVINQAGTNSNRFGFDFDGDGKADEAVYRPATGSWYVNRSSQGFFGMQFGIAADKIVPADYDGDGKTDIAVYRDGFWYLMRSSQGFTSVQFGAATDLPRPADFDGDGKADINVYRPSNGAWYRLNSSNGAFVAENFGAAEDKPVPADFDGDGKADITVYRPSNGAWYRLNSTNGAFVAENFGAAEDKPVPADFDGDGKADITVYRPSAGSWYRLNSTNGAFNATLFGVAEDLPVAADYDGDGKADIAVYRPSTGNWYRLNSTNGAFNAILFGIATDKPIPAFTHN